MRHNALHTSGRGIGEQRRKAFSLIELVIVVVIIAIIGAIAIPKMSRGAQGAGDSALIQDLSVLRAALDLYNTEHPTAQLTTGATATAVTSPCRSRTSRSGKAGCRALAKSVSHGSQVITGTDPRSQIAVTSRTGNCSSGWSPHAL